MRPPRPGRSIILAASPKVVAASAKRPARESSTVSTPALVDPLTQRELEILRLLPTHLTYQQIADELYVSPNTIKSYIKSIYRKLEADKRSDAVSTANSLGLI